MNIAEFKTGLKEIKENLKGITLQFIKPNSVRPYQTLREFGNAILNEEKYGYEFRINQAWTETGVVRINSIEALANLFVSQNVTGVSFEAYYQPKDLADYIRHGFTLND